MPGPAHSCPRPHHSREPGPHCRRPGRPAAGTRSTHLWAVTVQLVGLPDEVQAARGLLGSSPTCRAASSGQGVEGGAFPDG